MKTIEKGKLYEIALQISALDVAHDNLDSIWTMIDRVVNYYGPDEELEYDGVIPEELCDELNELSDKIQNISCKLLKLMERKERELKLGLGYTPEEIEKMEKFVNGVIGCTVGATILSMTDNKEGVRTPEELCIRRNNNSEED